MEGLFSPKFMTINIIIAIIENIEAIIPSLFLNPSLFSLIVFLIDVRHDPTENDRLMYNYIINTNSPCLVIANKADKIAVTKVDNAVQDLQNSLNPLKDLTFMPFSSERKIYSEDVWNFIEKYI